MNREKVIRPPLCCLHRKHQSPTTRLAGHHPSSHYQLSCGGTGGPIHAIFLRLCLSSASTIAVPSIRSPQRRSRFHYAITISTAQQTVCYSVLTSKARPIPTMVSSEVVINPRKPVYIHGAVADPDPTQSYIQPTKDNKTHIVHFTTPLPNRVSSSQALITKMELSQPHIDDCAFCAGFVHPSRESRERHHSTQVSLAGEGFAVPMLPPALRGDAAVGLEPYAPIPTEQSHV
jgi:hypothetical protein